MALSYSENLLPPRGVTWEEVTNYIYHLLLKEGLWWIISYLLKQAEISVCTFVSQHYTSSETTCRIFTMV